MKETLEQIRREALDALAGAADAQALDALRVKYLGKKGELTAVLKQMGKLSNQERPVIGQLANEVRAALEEALETCGSISDHLENAQYHRDTIRAIMQELREVSDRTEKMVSAGDWPIPTYADLIYRV